MVEELGLARCEVGLAELGGAGSLDLPAEVAGHELHAVADAQRRDSQVEDCGVEVGRPVRVDRRGASGQNQRRRVAGRELRSGEPMPHELRVHPRFAHAPRDELAVLAAEIDDEDGALLGRGCGRRERDDLGHGHRL